MSKKINDQKCYPYHMDHLPKSFYQKALEELNESAEAREIELNKLKELLSRCPDGCAIVLCELGKWNHNELSIEDVKRIGMFSFLLPLRCPMTQISGFKMIYDFTDTVLDTALHKILVCCIMPLFTASLAVSKNSIALINLHF
ncbi:hypothetical protein HNY73_015090 [Argiope bruennichi]|uniref:Uncharacterized protein n=1 Tax=Argiope bruennichi TaxID=94029 RepID=A0A8T0EWF2_ARGBR|nr:hypothetical protein HNY73_015090 [Argiope bruennichi]